VATTLGPRWPLTSVHIAGTAAAATITALLPAARATPFTVRATVVPALPRHSLLLAFGFSGAHDPAALATVERIQASLTPLDESGTQAARGWRHLNVMAVSLDYPADWLPDFASSVQAANSGASGNAIMIVGPADQALLYAASVATTERFQAGDAATQGPTVVAHHAASVHPGLHVALSKSAPGVYRWLATFPDAAGATTTVEVGQVVEIGNSLEETIGDTALQPVTTNLPLFMHSLDSIARAAGATQLPDFTVADAARAVQGAAAPAALQGQATSSTAGTGATSALQANLSADQRLQALRQSDQNTQARVTAMNNMMMEEHVTMLNIANNMNPSSPVDHYYVASSYGW
jgi:hypothetical protein